MSTTYPTRPLAGQKYGRWTLLDEVIRSENGQRKWLCRCDCGTRRHVLERSLLYGESESCGCLRRERAAKVRSADLTGQIFGDLTVLRRADGGMWLCRCACGQEYVVQGTLLTTGRRTRCGGKAHRKNYAYTDIAGKRFGSLTALHPAVTEKKSRSVIWRCRCDCGREVEVAYNSLVYCNRKSCGCRKKAHDQKLGELLIHVDGTSLEMIRSKKVPSDNTTGCRGVYRIRGKYTAKIVFQKKAYYLGSYDNMEDAVRARQEAEALLFDGTAAFYEKWNARAKADPAWAARNPVKISVSKDGEGELTVSYSPADFG